MEQSIYLIPSQDGTSPLSGGERITLLFPKLKPSVHRSLHCYIPMSDISCMYSSLSDLLVIRKVKTPPTINQKMNQTYITLCTPIMQLKKKLVL